MISKKTKYGLQALLALARAHGSGPVMIADLADQERIPKKFLEAILLQLKNVGILQSRKGRGGGYTLGKDPGEISIGQIVRILDGPLAPVECVSVTAYRPCTECRDEKTCGIHLVMKDVRDAIADILDHTSLTDMMKRSDDVLRQQQSVVDFQI